jgi:hypothetical protein
MLVSILALERDNSLARVRASDASDAFREPRNADGLDAGESRAGGLPTAIPIAVGVLETQGFTISPAVAALSMSGSSITS